MKEEPSYDCFWFVNFDWKGSLRLWQKSDINLFFSLFPADCDTGSGFERGGDVSQTSSLNSNTGSKVASTCAGIVPMRKFEFSTIDCS